MCGGEGTRLAADAEKPLFEVGGRPMLGRVLDALDGAAVDAVHAVTSPTTPDTLAYLDDRDATVIEGPGEGYVADLPLLAPAVVNDALAAYDGRNVTVCVPTRLKQALGVSAETVRDHEGERLSPTGLNVVAADDAGERVERVWDARAAVNVNYAADATVAEVLAG